MEAAEVSNFDAGSEDPGAAMRRLDRLIERAIANDDASRLAPPSDALRGLHIGAEDVSRRMAPPAEASSPGASDEARAKAEFVELPGHSLQVAPPADGRARYRRRNEFDGIGVRLDAMASDPHAVVPKGLPDPPTRSS